ncbi:hypothetical protein [Microseira sp. BLCC-F43]|uniref:hypothetical protein n=1 Tax=Microseira sp. BLCC-F43 TaxID=3153602 RepID=UPI0035B89859
MSEVWIVVDGLVDAQVASTSTTDQMVQALLQAINPVTPVNVQVVAASSLPQAGIAVSDSLTKTEFCDKENILLCPLTLNLPDNLQFPGSAVYQACRDVTKLRHQMQQLGYATGEGSFWLPIVLTAKAPLYAEVIGLKDNKYYQPIHVSDEAKQVLYQMGWRLLRSLNAPPATYLVQFGFEGKDIYFDKLLPFPGEAAIASIGIQSPDLFACHWHCLMGLPLFELTIREVG